MKSPFFILVSLVLALGGTFALENYQKKHIPDIIMLENAVYIHKNQVFAFCGNKNTVPQPKLLQGFLRWPLSVPKITETMPEQVYCQTNIADAPENKERPENKYDYWVFFTSTIPESLNIPQKAIFFPPNRKAGKQLRLISFENNIPIISGKDFAFAWKKDGTWYAEN